MDKSTEDRMGLIVFLLFFVGMGIVLFYQGCYSSKLTMDERMQMAVEADPVLQKLKKEIDNADSVESRNCIVREHDKRYEAVKDRCRRNYNKFKNEKEIRKKIKEKIKEKYKRMQKAVEADPFLQKLKRELDNADSQAERNYIMDKYNKRCKVVRDRCE